MHNHFRVAFFVLFFRYSCSLIRPHDQIDSFLNQFQGSWQGGNSRTGTGKSIYRRMEANKLEVVDFVRQKDGT